MTYIVGQAVFVLMNRGRWLPGQVVTSKEHNQHELRNDQGVHVVCVAGDTWPPRWRRTDDVRTEEQHAAIEAPKALLA